MNILLLGNGFDLFWGLPTKYIHFLRVVKYLILNTDCKTPDWYSILKDDKDDCLNHEFIKAISVDEDVLCEIAKLTQNNVLINYFFKSIDIAPDRWIDFEQQLYEINRQFMFLFSLKGECNSLGTYCYELPVNTTLEFAQMCNLIKLFPNFFEVEFDSTCSRVAINNDYTKIFELNIIKRFPDKQKIIDILEDALIQLSRALRLYLLHFVDKHLSSEFFSSSKLGLFSRFDYVLSFNYTNTYEKIITNSSSVLHLHGNVDNDIVLGYCNDSNDSLTHCDTLLLPFKKYYQRVYYGCIDSFASYKHDVLDVNKKEHSNHVDLFVFGFSLSRSDEDIIRDVFDSANKITIYCRDGRDLRSYIQNLVWIYGKDSFEKLLFEKTLRFIVGEFALSEYIANRNDQNKLFNLIKPL